MGRLHLLLFAVVLSCAPQVPECGRFARPGSVCRSTDASAQSVDADALDATIADAAIQPPDAAKPDAIGADADAKSNTDAAKDADAKGDIDAGAAAADGSADVQPSKDADVQQDPCAGTACDDGDPCTTDTCLGMLGCKHVLTPLVAAESCNGADDNCNGQTDEPGANGCAWFWADADTDGFGSSAVASLCLCAAAADFTALTGGDCDDANAAIFTGAQRNCINNKDNDCDGTIDAIQDGDGDGYAGCADCDDADPAVGPAAFEFVDKIDNDCDGMTDEAGVSCDLPGLATAIDASYPKAIDLCSSDVTSTFPTLADPKARAIRQKYGSKIAPLAGANFAVLSTGIAAAQGDAGYVSPQGGTAFSNTAANPNGKCPSAGSTFDYSEWKLTLQVPANALAFAFDFNFMSSEYPEWIGTNFNDKFMVLADSKSLKGNVVLDPKGGCLSINSPLFTACEGCSFGSASLAGSGYENGIGGGTSWITATASVKPGEMLTLRFIIFDEGDHVLDSVVLLDNFRWKAQTAGAVPVTAPTCGTALCTGKSCAASSECNDGEPCTQEACTAGKCIYTANPVSCDDGDACTSGIACAAMTCGKKLNCDDANACTTDSCDLKTGCLHLPAGATTSCDDANACTKADTCSGGKCVGGPPASCDDGRVCTTDSCVPASGCQYVPIAAGSACGGGKSCDGGGGCVPPTAPAGMALIPGGAFWMGCNSGMDLNCAATEMPQHKVTLSSYYMDLTEITVAHYKACVDAAFCTVPGTVQPATYATFPGLTNHPVNFVTWAQGRDFCKWRGAGFDLPTEAQWEMAARGSCEKNGSTSTDPACKVAMRTYPWGELPADCSTTVMSAGVDGCGTNATWPAGSKPLGDSPYGLHDMAGNVWEWNRDWFAAYPAGAQVDPEGPAAGTERANRGGGFNWAAPFMRAAARAVAKPAGTGVSLGLRCARSICGSDLACADSNPCTADTCDSSGVCQHTNVSAVCSDGNVCTTADVCSGGTCTGAGVLNCDDANECTADSCAAGSGCKHAPVTAGTGCSSGKVCDGAGVCTGVATPAGMVLIPFGTFWMGCNASKDANCWEMESPQHKVTLTSYFIDLTETTVGQYKACVDAGGCAAPSAVQPAAGATYPGLADSPVNFVSWSAARQYCKWRGAQFDLPTEAQWEMAARGSCEKNGSTAGDANCKTAMRTYPWGEAAPDCTLAVMTNGCSKGGPWTVAARPAGDSPYGLHDMAGNVYEWPRDDWDYYPAAAQTDPLALPGSTKAWVLRGGAYSDTATDAGARLRASWRMGMALANGSDSMGMRCVRSFP